MDQQLADRLATVERAVTDGETDLEAIAEGAATADTVADLEDRVESLEDEMAELEAATQALRGYVGQIRAVNDEVEETAAAALAKAERAGKAQSPDRSGESDPTARAGAGEYSERVGTVDHTRRGEARHSSEVASTEDRAAEAGTDDPASKQAGQQGAAASTSAAEAAAVSSAAPAREGTDGDPGRGRHEHDSTPDGPSSGPSIPECPTCGREEPDRRDGDASGGSPVGADPAPHAAAVTADRQGARDPGGRSTAGPGRATSEGRGDGGLLARVRDLL